jgi:hypothetical protein
VFIRHSSAAPDGSHGAGDAFIVVGYDTVAEADEPREERTAVEGRGRPVGAYGGKTIPRRPKKALALPTSR